jgi:signal transduction histidine kinase
MVSAENKAATSFCYLPALIDELVAQKQFEYSLRPGVALKFVRLGEIRGAFVGLNSLDFKAILSNLINNGVDSFSHGSGEVTVALTETDSVCNVKVSDNGVGIPAEYLKKLGSDRITFKGDSARGLGLVHAFTVIESWGGKVSIISAIGRGTSIEIELPKYVKFDRNVDQANRDEQLG